MRCVRVCVRACVRVVVVAQVGLVDVVRSFVSGAERHDWARTGALRRPLTMH